jgi:hypothetical protein
VELIEESAVDAIFEQSHRRLEGVSFHNPSLRSVFVIHASQLVITKANKQPIPAPPQPVSPDDAERNVQMGLAYVKFSYIDVTVSIHAPRVGGDSSVIEPLLSV